MTVLTLIAALFLVNLVTIVRFRDDKERAKDARRRIPERNLLALALIGGTPAAYLARVMFEHKKRKQPFSRYLAMIAAAQIAAALAVGALLWLR